jgi:hypothetical protein
MATVEASGGPGERPAPATPREQSLKARVLSLSRKAILDHGPHSTADLVEYVEAAGVTITGAHKPTTVSVILSRSEDFRNIRGLGWKLTNSEKEKTPQDAPTSTGSSTAQAVSTT